MQKINKNIVVMLLLSSLLLTLPVWQLVPVCQSNPGQDLYLHSQNPLEPVHMHGPPLVPIHMHCLLGIIPTAPPEPFTLWHELYPQYCENWVFTSWEDNGNGVLDTSDQIDMTNEATQETRWYHVDRVTYTMTLMNEFEELMYIEFKGPYEPPAPYFPYPPFGTLWHEVYPIYSNVYTILDWSDSSQNGILDYCDWILLDDGTWWHVEDIATDLILNEKIMDPVDIVWHELYPTYCDWWNLTGWEDNGDGRLSPSDQIAMSTGLSTDEMWDLFWSMGDVNRDGHIDGTDLEIIEDNYGWSGPPGGNIADINSDGVVNMKDMLICESNQCLDFWTYFEATWYHVDRVTLTLNVSNYFDPEQTMYIEYKGPFETMYDVKTAPIGSLWHEVYPEYCPVFQIVDWADNCNGVLSYCDYLALFDLETETTTFWHVEELSIDIILNEKITQPVCTYWNELHPEFGNRYHIIEWTDDGDTLLSPLDKVYLDPGPILPYNVKSVTLTLFVSDVISPSQTMYIEFEGGFEQMYRVKTAPLDSLWHQVYPVFCPCYIVTGWEDNCNGVLSYCDIIYLTDIDTLEVTTWRIEEVAIDIVVQLPVHDVAVTYVASRYPSVYQGLVDPIDVTVVNQGDFTETVDVYAFYDGNLAAPKQTVVLNPGGMAVLTFSWLTKGIFLGFYTISANATIPVDDDPDDNVLVGNKEQVELPPELYWKEAFGDYAPSGMPDFDQKQDAWDNPPGSGIWSWCAPTAVANSLWWYDSKYESNPIPPPALIDNYPLVTSYTPGVWDDHDKMNVQLLITHLAYLMDTDGIRTGLPHRGTWVMDMQAGIAHYLSWAGGGMINPLGDVNGDGKVDMTDVDIVTAALGTSPGMAGWDMRADIFPVTIGWPAISGADNIIDPTDLDLVLMNMGLTGTFHEVTVPAPEFEYIEEEIERSEDVVLVLGFWFYDGMRWIREEYPYEFESGHFVTAAGVNSDTWEIALSDPIQDNAEPPPQGTNGAGRVYPPPPHPHPPVPPDTLHNDASFVSHDIYNAAPLPPDFPAGIASFGLVNYASPQYPGQPLAVAEWAVIVSPLGVHDINVTNVTTSKDGCTPMPTLCQRYTANVTVTILNEGTFTENVTVTAYANTTIIGTKTFNNLAPSTQTTLTLTWNATGFAKGNYTVSATVTQVPGENDLGDNSFTDGIVAIVHDGDVDGNGKVDLSDVLAVAIAYGSLPGFPLWNPNLDIDGNGKVDLTDYLETAINYGYVDP